MNAPIRNQTQIRIVQYASGRGDVDGESGGGRAEQSGERGGTEIR